MDKYKMQQIILEGLSMELGADYKISIHEVLKTNIKLDGLTILKKGDNICPTIYLEPYYRELEDGASAQTVVNKILQSYSNAEIPSGYIETMPILDFGQMKERLFVKLINRHSNTELLQSVPHAIFLDDFAITVRCFIGTEGKDNASFLVHNNHLEIWKTDADTLLSLAIQNTREMFGITLKSMSEVLQELSGCTKNSIMPVPDAALPIWVMTNRLTLAGASAVLFDDVLKSFAEKHGSFYVIFSSVHEALLIPVSPDFDIHLLSEINRDVNKTSVRDEELLGTKAYFYDKDTGFASQPKTDEG